MKWLARPMVVPRSLVLAIACAMSSELLPILIIPAAALLIHTWLVKWVYSEEDS